jgi:large subunit ribosomal protein L24
MKLRKNDKVKIVGGKDKGKEGVIERVYPLQDKVLIPEINVYKKHIKKTEQNPQGGVVPMPRALNVANIALICPKCKKQTRIGYQIEDHKKVRICRKCKAAI